MKAVETKPAKAVEVDPTRIPTSDWGRLRAIEHAEPHRVLGAHPAELKGGDGVVIRAFHPEAAGVTCVLDDGRTVDLERVEEGGLFGVFLPGARFPLAYRLQFRFADDKIWEFDDPYRFLPTLGDVDLHLFNEGNHRHVWEKMGAHVRRVDGVDGVAFAVWAPGARRV
jgi:1,4-alpha-glucan branching enzyme